ncbi:hypothetical protein FSP39_021448 [Pinctada imbricata]|uniref:RanBP2-type domain-containing protein n=1 Tax=Pinctada imbricata TaxID=66713 RepID=A0AA88YT16_PINIB|nr:hypothetical protein FSP39_021448 [Pinctada imbricata]
MADTEARREARRQKILQNSKQRLNRLYDRDFVTNHDDPDTSTTTETDQQKQGNYQDNNWTCKICSHTNTEKREKCYLCNSQQKDTPMKGNEVSERGAGEGLPVDGKEHVKCSDTHTESSNLLSSVNKDGVKCAETHPESTVQEKTNTEHTVLRQRQTVKIQKAPVSEESSVSPTSSESLRNDKLEDSVLSPSQQFEMFRVLGCVLLAILCRMVLKTGYGLLYFQSVILPFVSLQFGLYYYKQQIVKDLVLQHRNNMMVTLLVLCGVKKDILTLYNNIMGYLTAIGEDFCLFVFVFVMSGIILV